MGNKPRKRRHERGWLKRWHKVLIHSALTAAFFYILFTEGGHRLDYVAGAMALVEVA